MIELIKQNKIIIAFIVIIVGGVVWFGLPQQTEDAPLTSEVVGSGGGSGVEREVLDTLLTLRNITLEGRILSDPVFQSLQDFSIEIQPEPVGRDNPFSASLQQSAAAAEATEE